LACQKRGLFISNFNIDINFFLKFTFSGEGCMILLINVGIVGGRNCS